MESQSSGLRVEEILADYFAKKDEKVKNKFSDDEDKSSNKEGSRHRHKRKKKSKKKHKRVKALDGDADSDSRSSHKHHKHSHDKSQKNSKHRSKRESSSDKKSDKRKSDARNSEKVDSIDNPKEYITSRQSDSVFRETNDVKMQKSDSTEIKQKDFTNSKTTDNVNIVSSSFKSITESLWTPISELKVECSEENLTPISILQKITLGAEIKFKDEQRKSNELCTVEISAETKPTTYSATHISHKIEKGTNQLQPFLPVNNNTPEITRKAEDLEEGELVEDPKDSDNKKEVLGEDDVKKKKTHKHKKRKKSSSSVSPERKNTKSSNLHKSSHHNQQVTSGDRKETRVARHMIKLKRSRSPDRKSISSRYPSNLSQSLERSMDSSRRRSRSPVRRVRDLRERIDKKQLLEIARRNVLEMIEAGTLPHGVPVANLQPQQLASIKAGGKSVQELTDFCKALAEKHKAYSSSDSDDEHRPPPGSDDEDAPFIHHPFKSKEAQPMIRMNIRNAVQLPLRTTAEKTADSVKLRQQFPVSSGNQHRTKELEWVPVEKTEKKPAVPTKKQVSKVAPLAIEAPPVEPVVAPLPKPVVLEPVVPPVDPADSVFVRPPSPNVDIGTIMSDRLNAMRKLQENPHDMQALSKMYHAQKLMQNWAQSKIQPGQFGHSVTNRLLTPEELNGPYPVWARKDQLTSATPVQGGIGMHLLKKMGWNPGEGLGKNKEGSLVPLMLDVKTDKKGLVSNTEAHKSARPVVAKVTHDLSGKHPVSALMELCSKRKWGAPDYTLLDETGPDHRKNFLFKVKVKGVDYQPSVSSASKKQAKALAATVCLQAIGLIPRDLSNPL